MQSAFFKISGVIPFDKAVEEMKKAIYKSYGKKGEDIVNMNYAAVDAGGDAVVKVEVPSEWASIEVKPAAACADSCKKPEFVTEIVEPINALKGDSLPVSAFNGREDGTWDNGTAAYEKRGVAVNVPHWIVENCIQCNRVRTCVLTLRYVPSLQLSRRPPRLPPALNSSRDWVKPRSTSSAFRSLRSTVRVAATAWMFVRPRLRLL